MLTDVVVPIPLPLSAILILVIGQLPCTCIRQSTNSRLHSADLGFELFVAVGFEYPSAFCVCQLTQISLQLSFAWDKPETIDGLMRMGPRKPGN